jgi:RNA polymerase sigma factor (sigma-70 family)
LAEAEREARFRVLYDSTRVRLVAYALRRTDSPEDAADAVSEVYAIAWRRLDLVPPDDARLYWLYATCRKVIANQLRRDRHRSRLTERIGAQLRGAVASSPESSGAMMAALALRGLAEEDRELLMLVSWEGLSPAAIGRVLGCSPSAVRVRLHRARARLSREMEQLELLPKRTSPSRHSQLQSTIPATTRDGEEVPKEA